MMDYLDLYKDVIALDFEFVAADGERQRPICLVAKSLKKGTQTRLWVAEGAQCPLPLGPEYLYVGYYASAEWNCFLSLGWDLPTRIIDLYPEYRRMTNGAAGHTMRSGYGLLAAAEAFGIAAMDANYKTDMRELIISGGPWSPEQQNDILEYCAEDVEITGNLFREMWPKIATDQLALTQALLRGRYTVAIAKMEFSGTPVDTELFAGLMLYWPELCLHLIEAVDQDYDIYEGTTFKQAKFESWVAAQAIQWPKTDNGKLKLDEATFRQMSKSHTQVASLHELRVTLAQMRSLKLHVGADGRNRTLLRPFAAKTSRNQPSTTKSIFGNSAWLRSLIKPEEGYGLAYVDYSSQEIAIAAALSGDQSMWQAYVSGDPYMAFAIQAGLAPTGATKASHKEIRSRCKQIVLGVGYGMGAESLALGAGIHKVEANGLLNSHKMTYRVFWKWAEANQMRALMGEPLVTPLGWKIQLRRDPDPNDRSLLNWPMQSTGADIMRLAACMLTEAGIEVCCPIHDAFLVRFSLAQEIDVIARTTKLMVDASKIVMGGHACRVDTEIVRYPDRYMDERGEVMFGRIMTLLDMLRAKQRPVPANS
ncbi:MAG: DNA polymerase I [Halieaceae bacterium]|jgi:DNA polymerase-1|nr:DNA polymerase I [Halieaceae bacterium]